MKTDSKLSRIVLTSPWFLLVFLVIPLLFILSVKLHVALPLTGSKLPLLYNNACFSLLAAIRFITYLTGMRRAIRYGADRGKPQKFNTISQSSTEVRKSLAAAGYQFDTTSGYAEKRDSGYLGTLILYAGLFVILFTGTLDNMRQFSGTLLHGVGIPVDLSNSEKYRTLVTGPFTTAPILPKMKIVRHFIPDATYPLGAAEVVFLSADGAERKVILKYPDPYRVDSFDIYMAKMLYEPKISVSIDGSKPVYNGKVMLWPLATKVNNYGYYTAFVEGNLDGEIYYQPEKSRLKMILRQGSNTLMNKELIFQVDRQQTLGNISFTCERMGVWSEIHVMRRRHMSLIFTGALVALIGLVMRLAFRPQRVWLEETPVGCRVRTVGKEINWGVEES